MTNETIISSLITRFSAPLPDFYKRRIIFWQDPDGEFKEMIQEIEIPGVEKLILTGSNNFYAKHLLEVLDTENSYLVYIPIEYTHVQDNWLLDIELYSEEFRADLLSMRLQELNLPATASFRHAVKVYNGFFGNKERVSKLQALGMVNTVGQLHLNIMAVLTHASENTAYGIIRAVLSDSNDLAENEAYQAICKFGNKDVFWEMVAKVTGYAADESAELLPLLCHMMITALSVTVQEEHFAKGGDLAVLADFVSEPHQGQCYALITDWLDDDAGGTLFDLARTVEAHLHLPVLFAKLDVNALLASECFPCINEVIVKHYLDEVAESVIKHDEIMRVIEQRRTMKDYGRVQLYYEGLGQIAFMRQFYLNHATGFHTVEHSRVWKEYTEDYYRMDQAYRRFHVAYSRCLMESDLPLTESYQTAADVVENLYKNWFLQQLGATWSNVSRDELLDMPRMRGIEHQENFYNQFVRPAMEQGWVYVIISDALRYCVAQELTEALISETKGTANLSSVQSVLPSATKYGMAALLPHRKLLLTDDLKVVCDWMSTEGTENRGTILRQTEPTAVAITYKELMGLKRTERQEHLRGAKVVYIYHNAIDAIGDKLPTEEKVFEACADAITEIKAIVRMIINELSGSRVLITADHGFIYTYKPLNEADKTEKQFVAGNIEEVDRRYIIASAGSTSEFLATVGFDTYETDKMLFAPMEYLRVKKAGGGEKYVHGGISLQEMCVPVIDFKNIRSDSKKFVDTITATVTLISQSRKVSNSIFSLDFFQKEMVGGKVLPATYEVSMRTAAGRAVSDVKTIIADKADADNNARVTRLRFTLKSVEFKKTDPYYLVITEKGKTTPLESTEFQIDVTFVNDFDL